MAVCCYAWGWVLKPDGTNHLTQVGEYETGIEGSAAVSAFNKCVELTGITGNAHMGYEKDGVKRKAEIALAKAVKAREAGVTQQTELIPVVQTSFTE